MDIIYEMLNEKAQNHGLSCAFLEGSTDDKTHVMIINRVTKKRVNYTLRPKKVRIETNTKTQSLTMLLRL